MYCSAERTVGGFREQAFGAGDSCITDSRYSATAQANAFTSTELFRAFDRAGRGRARWCLGWLRNLSASFVFRAADYTVSCDRAGFISHEIYLPVEPTIVPATVPGCSWSLGNLTLATFNTVACTTAPDGRNWTLESSMLTVDFCQAGYVVVHQYTQPVRAIVPLLFLRILLLIRLSASLML
jgi:hypothetical protein